MLLNSCQKEHKKAIEIMMKFSEQGNRNFYRAEELFPGFRFLLLSTNSYRVIIIVLKLKYGGTSCQFIYVEEKNFDGHKKNAYSPKILLKNFQFI